MRGSIEPLIVPHRTTQAAMARPWWRIRAVHPVNSEPTKAPAPGAATPWVDKFPRTNKDGSMKGLWAAILIVFAASPAQAFTCADVHALSRAQKAYYIKYFNITPAQQERIRVACYGGRSRHVISASE